MQKKYLVLLIITIIVGISSFIIYQEKTKLPAEPICHGSDFDFSKIIKTDKGTNIVKENDDIIMETFYDDLHYREGHIVTSYKDKEGLIDQSCNVILEPEYDSVYYYEWNDFESDYEYTIIVKLDDTFTFINKDIETTSQELFDSFSVNPLSGLRTIISNGTISYDDIDSSNVCYNFIVEQDGKYGMSNHVGELEIPILYDDIIPTCNDTYIVELDGYYGVIDYNGSILLDIEYDSVDVNSSLYSFTVKKDGIVETIQLEVK